MVAKTTAESRAENVTFFTRSVKQKIRFLENPDRGPKRRYTPLFFNTLRSAEGGLAGGLMELPNIEDESGRNYYNLRQLRA